MKVKTFLFALLSLLAIACSSEDSEQPPDFSEILVEQSPWVLDRVEIVKIQGPDGYEFTTAELEEIAERRKNSWYQTFTFYSDGTLLWNREGYCTEPDCIHPWNLTEANELRWCIRSYCYFFDIHHSNGVTELIENSKFEEGFGFISRDGQTLQGEYLELNYIWN